MSELNSYLMAKLMPKKSPEKSIASEFAKEMVLDSFQTLANFEEDYSTGSDFWKSAIEKNVVEEKVVHKVVKPEQRFSMPKSKSTASVANLLKKVKNDHDTIIEPIQHVPSTVPESQQVIDQLRSRISKIGVFVGKEIKEIEGMVGKAETVQEHEKVVETMESFKTQIHQKLQELIEENGKVAQEYKNFQQKVLEQQTSSEQRLKEWIEAFHQETATKMNQKQDQVPLNVSKLMEELKLNLPSGSSSGIDRPTKNIIIGLNDKLIQLAKLQEHSFESVGIRLGHLEKKQAHSTDPDIKSLLHSIETRLDRFEKRARDNDLDLQRILDSLSKRSGDNDSDDDSDNQTLKEEIKEIKKLIESESQITQDRMNQFMNMFTILQDALFSNMNVKPSEDKELKKLVQEQHQKTLKLEKMIYSLAHENDRIVTMVNNINTTLVKYLPLNLETKLHKIEALLSE